jgi:hypothetical protein
VAQVKPSAYYYGELNQCNALALLGTAAIAGLHVPGTKVICIDQDEEVLELAKIRVQKFKEKNRFELEEAYAIFAKCNLIPSKGASEAAGGFLSLQLLSDEEDDDEESDSSNGHLEDEEINALDLLDCRLKLRPPASDSRTYRNCFLETLDGAQSEALSTGYLAIRPSTIPGAGNGLFAKENIPQHQRLLHYWGDIYAIPEDESEAVVESLKTVRMVKTRKFVMKGSEKLK